MGDQQTSSKLCAKIMNLKYGKTTTLIVRRCILKQLPAPLRCSLSIIGAKMRELLARVYSDRTKSVCVLQNVKKVI